MSKQGNKFKRYVTDKDIYLYWLIDACKSINLAQCIIVRLQLVASLSISDHFNQNVFDEIKSDQHNQHEFD